MSLHRTVWLVGPEFTHAGGGYFGRTPADSLESLGRLVTRIAETLHRQGATEGVLLLDGKAARICGMSDPMDGPRHRALDSAAGAGWDSGTLGDWTVIHAKDRPTVHVGQLERLDRAAQQDSRAWPFAHPYAPDVVEALQAWHRLTGVAWQAGAPVMGLELMHKTMTSYTVTVERTGKQERRRPDKRDDSTPDEASVSMWTPQMWHRPVKSRWMHGYDKRRAGITAASVAKLSPAKLRRSRREFDPKRAGWWLVPVPTWNVPEMPHPFGPAAEGISRLVGGRNRMWVPTAKLDLAAELSRQGVLDMPEVIDSYTGPARTVLTPWSQRIERAYQAPTEGEYDDTARDMVRAALKLAGNAGIGMVGKVVRYDEESGKPLDSIPTIWRRDWKAAIDATKQCNAWRKAWEIGRLEERWPEAFDDDKIWYASDEADPYAAAPAGLGNLDKDTPGHYRAESTVNRKRKGTK